jgi:hypothetical protein
MLRSCAPSFRFDGVQHPKSFHQPKVGIFVFAGRDGADAVSIVDQRHPFAPAAFPPALRASHARLVSRRPIPLADQPLNPPVELRLQRRFPLGQLPFRRASLSRLACVAPRRRPQSLTELALRGCVVSGPRQSREFAAGSAEDFPRGSRVRCARWSAVRFGYSHFAHGSAWGRRRSGPVSSAPRIRWRMRLTSLAHSTDLRRSWSVV